jgi:hypothetical protein
MRRSGVKSVLLVASIALMVTILFTPHVIHVLARQGSGQEIREEAGRELLVRVVKASVGLGTRERIVVLGFHHVGTLVHACRRRCT